MNSLNQIISQDCGTEVCCKDQESYLDTIVGNLQRKQARAKAEYDNTTAALEALKTNPQIATVLELVARAGR